MGTMLTWNFLWDCTPRHLDTSGLGWLVSCGPKIRGKPQHYLQSNESQIFRTLGVGPVIATVHKAIQHSLVRLAFFMVINKSLSANTVLAKETQHETKTKSTALDSLQMVSKAPDLSHITNATIWNIKGNIQKLNCPKDNWRINPITSLM